MPAHISLFHTLPAERLEMLVADIAALLPDTSSVTETSGIRFLGRRNAYMVSAPGLKSLHTALSTRHAADLTAQDRQTYKPHITVQNKVDPAEGRCCTTG